ncbi:MAG TPA: DNA polymerase III subunit gamma/tau [Steroidobacteraceae bacterium]|jgi:DNA polymerase-3 subunit gamma/tau|nr:DNA polymerase III subunit gamma/tau [Steroidobacteraceae bacterium]
MSYLVLARKWRPRNFSELVGQEHVRQALVNALDSGRVHHAFLFTGTRGVGKTTIARILARSLNCERGVGSEPCGECAACREIDEGRFVDLIEVDAASRTKVDDTRDLLDNVQYLPTRGRYKVYLIDEVHMLSAHSFNALLKTLEEPPPHVKFLLATTDPQKLPVTVLSRCLQFNLKRLPASLIAGRLSQILGSEGIAFEAPAVDLLARAADGSLRDALSLLDQMLAFGGGRVTEADARAMLGTVDRQQVVRLVERLAARDASGLFAAVAEIDEFTPDYGQLLDEIAALLQKVALRQAVPGLGEDETHPPAILDALAAAMAPEDLQIGFQFAITGRRDLELAPDPRTGFEMTLLRMLAFRTAEVDASQREPVGRRAPSVPAATPAKAAPAAAPATGGDWPELLAQLELKGPARQLAANCQLLGREGDHFRFLLDERASALRTRQLEERFVQALRQAVGPGATVEIECGGAGDTPVRREAQARDERLERARAALESDPAVKALRDRFGAVLQPDSIKPVG